MLQQITDTLKNDPFDVHDVSHGAELQQPHYSRTIGQNDINENQMRKMRLNDYDPRRQHQGEYKPVPFITHDTKFVFLFFPQIQIKADLYRPRAIITTVSNVMSLIA